LTASTASKASRAEREERQGGAQSFTKLTSYSVFVAGCRFKRLLGNTCNLFELGSYGLLCVLGEQCGDTSSCGFGQTNRTGHHAFEEFLDVAANRGFRFDSGALACFGQTTLDFGTALFALVPFGSEDQALLRSTFWPLNLVSRAIRCGDLIQRHG
jgi:hypothetical protein